MFELEVKQIRKIVSGLIISNRVQGNIDYENGLFLVQSDDSDMKELQ